jgi:hypothetical protein
VKQLIKALCFAATCVSGCTKPGYVTTIKSPLDGVSYTVETAFGFGGAIGSVDVSVYARLQRSGQTDKALVLSGSGLRFSSITWNTPHDVTFCLDGGITGTFHNIVLLRTGERTSEEIHNHLRDDCR